MGMAEAVASMVADIMHRSTTVATYVVEVREVFTNI